VDKVRTIAVLGPNAANAMVMGGGSAAVNVTHKSQPLDALRNRLGGSVEIVHGEGCRINKKLPELDRRLIGNARIDYFADPASIADPSAKPDKTVEPRTYRMIWFKDPLGRPGNNFGFGARFTVPFTPDVTGEWEIGLESVADSRILVDGVLLLRNGQARIHAEGRTGGRPDVRDRHRGAARPDRRRSRWREHRRAGTGG
jgi:beta-glucosidase